jgi:hypothetical protein
MDGRGGLHYMRAHMNLLLLLSALMSALTGVISGGRAPQAAVAQVAVQRAAEVRQVAVDLRSWLALAEAPVNVVEQLVAPFVRPAPLFLSKRRE